MTLLSAEKIKNSLRNRHATRTVGEDKLYMDALEHILQLETEIEEGREKVDELEAEIDAMEYDS